MAHNRLRVYYGPEDHAERTATQKFPIRKSTVTVPLCELLPALADAVARDRQWVYDFADDEVTISSDLYEVILAYEQVRRPSA